jgi:hypothetical protein
MMTIADFGLIHDQHNRLTGVRLAFHHLAGERRHNRVGVNERVHQHPPNPLKSHVNARHIPRQTRRQIHEICAPDPQHGGDQQRQILPLRLALPRQKPPKRRRDPLRYADHSIHNSTPPKIKAESLNHIRIRQVNPENP